MSAPVRRDVPRQVPRAYAGAGFLPALRPPGQRGLPGDAIEVWVRHEPQLVASAGAQSAPCRQLRHVDEPSGVRGDLKKQGGADER